MTYDCIYFIFCLEALLVYVNYLKFIIEVDIVTFANILRIDSASNN